MEDKINENVKYIVNDDVSDVRDKGDRVSVSKITKFSRGLAKKYVWKFAIIFLITLGLLFIVSFIDSGISRLLMFDISIVTNIIQILIFIGITGFYLNIARGLKTETNHFWKSITRNRIWKYFVTSILNGVLVTVGFIFFIIPGFIFYIRCSQSLRSIIDKGLGPIEAKK